MEVRNATLQDVPGIARLVARYVQSGEILPRPVETI
jgi:N-acetylglutamate synthase-like GNAT family acetyltransferase